MSDTHELERIAVIGMAGRFPKSPDLDTFWSNLQGGVDCITDLREDDLRAAGIPEEQIADPSLVRRTPKLTEIGHFDAGFFGYAPREAEILDPQQRVYMETAWKALESAGYVSEDYPGWIAHYAGISTSNYMMMNLLPNNKLMGQLGFFPVLLSNDRDYFATRISYKLNLRGPAMNIQTACSTSLVAVHQACMALLGYQCNIALAGGVRVGIPQDRGYTYIEGSIFSPTGRCRSFDADADGSIFGDGCGVVVLKRLSEAIEDGDNIHAVILASALNNDGSNKVGFTAPSIEGQAEAIGMCQDLADIDPETITYIETHGSGTPLGDPIEVRALTKVFQEHTERKQFCAIGSVKSNTGHLEAASGIAGMIKTILSLENQQVPASLHFKTPNPQIDFANSPFFVNDQLRDWTTENGTPRRAGISSFGMGGTNAHVILEEAPPRDASGESRPWQLLTLAAKTSTALDTMSQDLAHWLRQNPEAPLADVAFTLQSGRRHFERRRALVCHDRDDALKVLETFDASRLLDGTAEAADRPLTFLCSGVGEQYPGMAKGLYEHEPTFRAAVDECCDLLQETLGVDLREVLFPEGAGTGDDDHGGPDLRSLLGRAPQNDPNTDRLNRTAMAQPAVFVLDYAMAQLWMEWGFYPESLVGYSLGEYAAACLAGVLPLADALRLVARRAQLIEELPGGVMLAIPVSETEARELITGTELDLAALNGDTMSVLAGPEPAIAALEARLDEREIAHRRLATSHAFHSRMMDSIREAFAHLVRESDLQPPEIPLLSNVTGTWMTDEEATDPEYWVRHLCGTVRFADNLAELNEEAARVMIELGPGRALSTLALQTRVDTSDADPSLGAPSRVIVPSLRSMHERQSDVAFLLRQLAELWLAGLRPDWASFRAHEYRHRLALPNYPFERQHLWVDQVQLQPAPTAEGADGPAELDDGAVPEEARHERPSSLRTPYVAPSTEAEVQMAEIWQDLLGVKEVGIHDDFFQLGGHSLLAPQLLNRLRRDFEVDFPLQALFQTPTVAKLLDAVETIRQEGSAESLIGEAVDLPAEVVLPDDIQPQGELNVARLRDPHAVLLTGATGFLGAFLLDQLLRQTRATVYCVVRGDDEAAAAARLRRQLEERKVWRAEDASRIVTVLGDLAEPRWGLSEARFAELAAQTDAVYHCGAWVNFTYPYEILKPGNVGGTLEAIRFACLDHVKPLHFISSVAVFAMMSKDLSQDRQVMEDDPLRESEGMFAGYGQTKWVGEKLVDLARERGLPASIYRPGVVGGHSETGSGNTSDFVWAFLKGCIQLGAAPMDYNSMMDVAPVDYVAASTVALSLKPDCLHRAYHFPNSAPRPWREVFDMARDFGYPMRRVSLVEWGTELGKLIAGDTDNAMAPFAPMFAVAPSQQQAQEGGDEEMQQEAPPQLPPRSRSLYNDRQTQEGLEGTGISCPPVDSKLIDTYIDYFIDVGYLDPPPVAGVE